MPDTINVEYTPGHYVTCTILRELVLSDCSTVELAVWNPLTQSVEYVYDAIRWTTTR